MKKKFILITAVISASVALYADGAATAAQAMQAVGSEITSLIATALPIVSQVAVAGLGLYMIPKAVSWVKRAAGR